MKHIQGMEEKASASASALQDAQRSERVRADSKSGFALASPNLGSPSLKAAALLGRLTPHYKRTPAALRDFLRLGYEEKLSRFR